MRWPRLRLTYIMGAVALIALGLGIMKAANEWLARAVILSSGVGLLVATLGAIVRRRDRPAWAGVALFGWGYTLVAMGMPWLADQSSHKDAFDFIGVDGLVAPLAARFHPEPSKPVDPFPNHAIGLNEATGIYSKLVGGTKFPLTAEELQRELEYESRFREYVAGPNAAMRSLSIGLTIQGIAFALLGGVVGQLLSCRPADASATVSPESDLPTGRRSHVHQC